MNLYILILFNLILYNHIYFLLRAAVFQKKSFFFRISSFLKHATLFYFFWSFSNAFSHQTKNDFLNFLAPLRMFTTFY